MAVQQHEFGFQHGQGGAALLSYMRSEVQCFDFYVRGRGIIPAADVEADTVSPNNCK
jgi:hypothetical protein